MRTSEQIQQLLADIHEAVAPSCEGAGQVANYIPELGLVDPNGFGVHIATVDGRKAGFGESEKKFSIQSIAKVFALVLAYDILGEQLWRRVDVEPSGSPFNSLIQLEADMGIPRNPMINAGALVVADVLVKHYEDPKRSVLEFVRSVAHDPSINYDESVAASELATGFRNEALIQFMRSFNNIDSPVEAIMDFYCHLCALSLNCRQLANAFGFLANRGVIPITGERVLRRGRTKRINAVMQLCGFYDEAGEFAFRVGLPGKSGVGGGIVAIYPGDYAVAVYSPKLNPKGNSVLGFRFLEEFTTIVEESIF